MYNFFVVVHNIMRWAVVIFGFFAIFRSLLGWIGKKSWVEIDRKLGLFFTISIDVQLLVGLILYFVYSEWALKAILTRGFSFVMGQGEFRYFAIEHGFYMILAFIFAHLGSVLPKKAKDSINRYKRSFFWFGLAMLLILAGIPWSRPLLPGL
jgi:hypothetical protein